MGGPSKSDIAKTQAITDQQIKLGNDQLAASTADKAKMDAAIQPALDFNTNVTKDPQSLLVAMAPLLTNITRAKAQSKEAIYDSVPRGPARDLALAQNERAAADDVAVTKNTTYTSALDKLANIGSGLGSFSLQETGAGLSGLSSGVASNNDVMQVKAQKKAAALAPLTALAGGAGAAIGGSFFKPK